MKGLDELKQQLDNLLIDYDSIGERTVALTTKPVIINACSDGLYMYGWGFSGIWAYSAKFIAQTLDRKFREEMEGIKMGRPRIDLTGQRFGKLVVVKKVAIPSRQHSSFWLCRCDCGGEKVVSYANLRSGKIRSCDCAHATICWECIHSAAPEELQCVWDKSKGKVLPKGATYVTIENSVGTLKRVTSCPQFERMNLEGRPKK